MARKLLMSLFAVAVLSALPMLGDEHTGPIGKMNVSSAAVQWQAGGAFDHLVLVVQLPSGESISREFTGSMATFRPSDVAPYVAGDGLYHYELRGIPKVSDSVRNRLAEAHERGDDAAVAAIRADSGLNDAPVQAGVFTIANGSFVTDSVEPGTKPETKVEGSPEVAEGKLGSTAANSAPRFKPGVNDIVQTQNEEIQDSLCVGLDCVNGESFGFDTIKLKENNTRIHFQDTSTSPGFPNVSWQLTANDSASGGANKFSIDDLTNSKTPFTVTAAAPTNSLFVASNGNVGFGNNAPVLNLHITSTNTPAIRQEQTSGGGFTAWTWDIGANEANWFVRDVTSGSRLPLRIRPGAPTSSVDISASGKVGFGTASPASQIDAVGTMRTTAQTVPSSGAGTEVEYLAAASTGTVRAFDRTGSVYKSLSLNDTVTVTGGASGFVGVGVTNPTNPIQAASGALLTAGGVWTNASSREFKDNICDLDGATAMETLRELNPVTFTYKVDKDEHHVGFIAEDVPDLVAAKNRKSLSAMDIVAVLTKAVQEQQKTIDELKAKIDELTKKQ